MGFSMSSQKLMVWSSKWAKSLFQPHCKLMWLVYLMKGTSMQRRHCSYFAKHAGFHRWEAMWTGLYRAVEAVMQHHHTHLLFHFNRICYLIDLGKSYMQISKDQLQVAIISTLSSTSIRSTPKLTSSPQQVVCKLRPALDMHTGNTWYTRDLYFR